MKIFKTFSLKTKESLSSIIKQFFEGIGYETVAISVNHLVFQRGSWLATFYATDVKKIKTKLNVYVRQIDDSTNISCDFEIGYLSGILLTDRQRSIVLDEIERLKGHIMAQVAQA